MAGNPLNYVNYDFDALVKQLTDRVKLSDTWKDTYRSSTGQMLIELYGYIANLVLYYVERRASEQYLDTAQLKSSIVNLVKLLNYTPKRRVSATGKLTFSIPAPATKKIFIPKYTECQTAAGIKYLTLQDVVIFPGQSEVTVSGIQGVLVTVSTTADGTDNFEYKITDTNVENTNLWVYVAGVLWNRVDSFLDSTNTSKDYRLITELDDTLTLRFGNNIFGLSPTLGQEILVKYIQTDGLEGNVYELGKINTVNSVIYDEDGNVVTVAVTNSDLFLGGDDAEDKEEIRVEAPKVFKTGDRLVNKEDYVSLLENYPGIATANAWGENEENPPNYNMFNKVKLVILLNEWQLASTTFKQQLSEYLYTKSMLTVKYEYINPVIVYVYPSISIKVERTGSLSQVQYDVEKVFEDEFVLGSTTKLGISKYYSNVVDSIENVSGLAHHYLTLELYRVLDIPFDSYYTYGANLEMLGVAPRSVRVFVGSQQVAIDDGAGNFTSLISAYSVSGSVDYTTGYCGLNISPAPGSGDIVSVRYQQNANGDLLVSANQILRLYGVDVTNIAYV